MELSSSEMRLRAATEFLATIDHGITKVKGVIKSGYLVVQTEADPSSDEQWIYLWMDRPAKTSGCGSTASSKPIHPSREHN
jgi:hypothetical protein